MNEKDLVDVLIPVFMDHLASLFCNEVLDEEELSESLRLSKELYEKLLSINALPEDMKELANGWYSSIESNLEEAAE